MATGRMIAAAVLGITAVFCAGLFSGCEGDRDVVEPLSENLRISPTEATVGSSPPESVLFTASGGTSPYTWGISDSTIGDISTSENNTIYASTEGETGVNVITVTDSELNAVSATITQQ
ncbi:MAG: hypothetical protein R6V03_07105 [Kiritimatiellia bacterium]